MTTLEKSAAQVGFENFQSALSDIVHSDAGRSNGYVYAGELLNYVKNNSVSEKNFIGRVFNRAVEFLNRNQLFGSDKLNTVIGAEREYAGLENHYSIGGQDNINNRIPAMVDELITLATECEVPSSAIASTVELLASTLLDHYNGTSKTNYWKNDTNNEALPLDMIYPKSALGDVQYKANMALEMFGATMSEITSDVRIAMTVALLKPHKGIMGRFMHRRVTNGSTISYQIFQNEFYDLVKSNNVKSKVRNGIEHRFSLIDLLKHPDPVTMTLIRAEQLKSNDIDTENPDVLVADNVIKFGKQVNLFDLGTKDVMGFDKHNYTDILSERVQLTKVYFDVTHTDGTVESFIADTSQDTKHGSFFQQQPTNRILSERRLGFDFYVPLHNGLKLADMSTTTIFAPAAMDGAYPVIRFSLSGMVRLDTADLNVSGTALLQVRGQKDTPIPAEITALKDAITVTLVGYEVDAKYSEENFRKVTYAVRCKSNTVQFDLPQGKGVIADWSFGQVLPEQVMNAAQEVMAIGIDNRNLRMFLKILESVNAAHMTEYADPNWRENSSEESVNTNFVSHQRVNPCVLFSEFDLDKIKSIRSMDQFGDIRQEMESYLVKLISILHYVSLLPQQTDGSERITYKVITTSTILENLMAIPHTHAHLNAGAEEKLYQGIKPGSAVEYTRELASGVKLECITTAFDFMQDTIMIVPYVGNDPVSELNFGQNWDGGQFTANYTPVDGSQANRRAYVSTREFPIVTTPIAAIIKVKNLTNKLPDVAATAEVYLKTV